MRLRALLAVCVIAGAAACGGESAEPAGNGSRDANAATEAAPTAPEPQQPEMATAPADDGATEIIAADSEFGDMLYAGNGQAIYLFDIETDGRPLCYDDCARAWPPVLTEAAPRALAGAHEMLVGTVARDDGATQVTYNGWPLYFYAAEGLWEVKCHNVTGFGGLWLVVTPEGNAAPH